MPAKNRRKLPNIYILHRSFVFIKYIYIYETRMVESGNNRNFGRKEAKVSDGDIWNIWNIKKLRSLTIVYRARGNVDFYYYTTTYLRAKAVYDRSLDEEQWASEMERFPVKNGGKASNGTKEVHHEKSWRRR